MSVLTATAKGVFGVTRRLPALLTASTVGWLGYSALRRREAPPLPDPFASVQRRTPALGFGDVVLHETRLHTDRRDPTPVLFVHSVNAAASSYEMAPLFQRVERERFSAAMDLPGFGHSDRPDVDYTPGLMADAIAAALDTFERPVHVVALSLGSELTARACRLRPDLVRSVTMISPTGLGSESRIDIDAESMLDRVLAGPLVGQALYDLLVTDWSISYFLSKSSREVDPGMSIFAGLTSKQDGARHAPLDFLTGRLFTPDALSEVYQPLTVPTLTLYDQDPYTDFAYLPEFIADGRGTRHAERIPGTRGLPHFDKPGLTLDAIHRFWKEVDAA